jgi:hypothetical protein
VTYNFGPNFKYPPPDPGPDGVCVKPISALAPIAPLPAPVAMTQADPILPPSAGALIGGNQTFLKSVSPTPDEDHIEIDVKVECVESLATGGCSDVGEAGVDCGAGSVVASTHSRDGQDGVLPCDAMDIDLMGASGTSCRENETFENSLEMQP